MTENEEKRCITARLSTIAGFKSYLQVKYFSLTLVRFDRVVFQIPQSAKPQPLAVILKD